MNDNNKKCLTKADLADSIFDTLSVDKSKSSQIIEDFIELIKVGLEEDDKVMISGFGAFEVKQKNPRRGRNPQTGESIILKARKRVSFKTSQILRQAINSNKPSIESFTAPSEQ